MLDIETLQMALIGYQAEREKIKQKINEIESRLDGHKAAAAVATAPRQERRRMSAAAKARIRLAQKKRWAEYRKQKAKLMA